MIDKKSKYLDPKNDLTFRKIFGEHPHIMKSFLNSVMPFEEDRYIESLVYQDPAMIPELPELKHSIVDVKCTDNYGRQFIVEMQMYWTSSFKSRMLFNSGKAYVKQLDEGESYNALCPVYGLSLVNDEFLTDKKYENQYYHHYKMLHNEISEEVIEGIELIFIELPKFKARTFTEKKLHILWLRFLTEIGEKTEEAPEELLANEVIKEALEHLQVSAFTKEELAYYDKYLDNVRIEQLGIKDLKDQLNNKNKQLEKERRQKKEAKVREKEAKVREKEAKAREKEAKAREKETKLKLAKQMIKYGESIEDIIKETGLTKDEIKKLA